MNKIKLVLLGILSLLLACVNEQAIPVTADFQIKVLNDDHSVPVNILITNKSIGAESYKWTFKGGSPEFSTDRNPGTITYTTEGNYTILLEATNRDESFDSKEIQVPIDAQVRIGFNVDIVTSNYSPVEISISNTTVGATTYLWTFEGGTPATSIVEKPTNIIFTTPGVHKITLAISNGLEEYSKEKNITVAPHLISDFDYKIAFEDDDLQVPVKLTLENKSTSVTDYLWTFTGGSPSTSTAENPIVIFNTPGTYSLKLEATNGKESETITKSITVIENTNLRIFENIKLGINTAHNTNTIGAFFSTITREVYQKDEIISENSDKIDIPFFGLSQNFTVNKFVSPDEVQTTAFDALTNATHTKFINSLELCACSAALTTAQFDTMTDDSLLDPLVITESIDGLKEFNNSLAPRIVLFETFDGRKGAIKIKEYKTDGQNSYILVDIKVQKE